MILLGGLLLGLVVSWALGADLSRLASVRLRAEWLVFAALAVQVAIFTSLRTHVPAALDRPIHLASYALVIAFLALNLRRSGFWLAGFGLVSNVVVIAANGGRMPVSLHAWTAAGGDGRELAVRGAVNNNVLAGPHTHLAFLGDVFPLPPVVPLANALSIGDVLIVVGLTAFVYRACARSLPRPAHGFLAPLHAAEFRRVLAGRTTSRLGDWLTMSAIVTWVYATTHSTAAVSSFLVARILATIAGGFVSAPLLDRICGFRALASVEAARGAVTLAMLPFALAGHVWPAIALACVSSFLGSATNPSARGLVPRVLPREQLQAGNALHGVARNVTTVLGAATGGLAVARFGIGSALALDVATFVLAALLYRRFAGVHEDPAAAGGAGTRRELAGVLVRNRVVFGLTASFTVVTAAMGVLNASLPAFFDARFGSATAYGYALAAIGAGLMCGEFLTAFIRRESVARRSISLAFLGSAATAYVALHAGVPETAYLMLFALGACDGTTEVVYDTLVQLHVPARLLSGTFAAAAAIQNAGMVAGLVAASVVGPGTALRLCVAGCVAGAALAGLALVRRIAPERDDLAAAPDPA